MSYKDLEAEIARWANLEAFAAQQKAETEAHKAYLKRKAKWPVKHRPEPVCFQIEVTLNVRQKDEAGLGELTEAIYVVTTLSEVEAELQAKAQAKAAGFVWRGTVATKRKG